MAAHTYTILRQLRKRARQALEESGDIERTRKYLDDGLSPVGMMLTTDEWSNLHRLFGELRTREELVVVVAELSDLVVKYRTQARYPCYEAIVAAHAAGAGPLEELATRQAIEASYPLSRIAPALGDEEDAYLRTLVAV